MMKRQLIRLVPELRSIYAAARRYRFLQSGVRKERAYIRLRDRLYSVTPRRLHDAARSILVDEMRM